MMTNNNGFTVTVLCQPGEGCVPYHFGTYTAPTRAEARAAANAEMAECYGYGVKYLVVEDLVRNAACG